MGIKETRTVNVVAGFLGSLATQTGDYELGTQQHLLLLSCYLHGTLNQSDLHRFTGVGKSANGRNIARLGAGQFVFQVGKKVKIHRPGLGLVESFRDPMNQRIKLVRLTPKGRVVVEQAVAEVAPFLGGIERL